MRPMRDVFRLIYRFDSKGLRTVLFAALFGALIDVAGVASVTPFLSLISKPEMIQQNAYFASVYSKLNFGSERSFIIFVGGATIVFLTTVAAVRGLIASRVIFFIHWQRHNISYTLFKNGFYAPQSLTGGQHSSVLTSRVFGETDVFIDSAVRPLIELIVHGTLLCAMLGMLLIADFSSTLVIILFLGVFFSVVILTTRRTIIRSGEDRAAANAERYRSLKEALSGAQELRLLGREKLYVSRFRDASKTFARSVAKNQTILQVATYAVQALTFAGIIALTIALLGKGGDLSEVIPSLGLFLFAGYRIMPAANICYRATSTLRYAKPAIYAIQESLGAEPAAQTGIFQSSATDLNSRIACDQEIRLENVRFSYGEDKTPLVIDELKFPARKIIGITGPSGSGKSTLFSLLLGILAPQQGRITIDGIELDQQIMRRWHNTIGFVSQRPFFSDESIGANIALGLSPDERNQEAIEAAAGKAHATEFIDVFPKRFDALVGEDGGQLSGGQRQRISIARALYHQPDVLFLDEITSALDGVSEKAVSEAVSELRGSQTVFIIAHRPAMLEICDVILKLEAGYPVYFGDAHAALNSLNFNGDVSDGPA